MPHIWEHILTNLSVSEVAVCLKVCKSLRSTIGKCLESQTKFHRKLNLAATMMAVDKEKVQCVEVTNFHRQKFTMGVGGEFFGIDDVWLYREALCIKNNVEVIKLQREQGEQCFKESLPTIYQQYAYQQMVEPISAFPTLNPKVFFINGCNMFHSSENASTFPTPLRAIGGDVHEVISDNVWHRQPVCIRYMLFEQKKVGAHVLSMGLLNNNGEFRKIVTIDKSQSSYFGRVRHLASNEQVVQKVFIDKHLHISHTCAKGWVRGGGVKF